MFIEISLHIQYSYTKSTLPPLKFCEKGTKKLVKYWSCYVGLWILQGKVWIFTYKEFKSQAQLWEIYGNCHNRLINLLWLRNICHNVDTFFSTSQKVVTNFRNFVTNSRIFPRTTWTVVTHFYKLSYKSENCHKCSKIVPNCQKCPSQSSIFIPASLFQLFYFLMQRISL